MTDYDTEGMTSKEKIAALHRFIKATNSAKQGVADVVNKDRGYGHGHDMKHHGEGKPHGHD